MSRRNHLRNFGIFSETIVRVCRSVYFPFCAYSVRCNPVISDIIFPDYPEYLNFKFYRNTCLKALIPPALFPPPSLSTAGSRALTFLPVLLKWGLGQWESGTLTVHPSNLRCLHIFPLWTFSFRLKWGLSKRWLALIKRALHPSNNWWQTREWKVLYEHRRENETWNRSGKESGISGEELLFAFSGLKLRELKNI